MGSLLPMDFILRPGLITTTSDRLDMRKHYCLYKMYINGKISKGNSEILEICFPYTEIHSDWSEHGTFLTASPFSNCIFYSSVLFLFPGNPHGI